MPPEPPRLDAAVFYGVRVLPWYQRPRLRPRASVARHLMRTLGVLFVLSGRVRELFVRCLAAESSVVRSRARPMSGSG